MLGETVTTLPQPYKTGWIDPRAALTRKKLRSKKLNDLADTMRWGLHMSEQEADWLAFHNPETLGCSDTKLRSGYWKHFIMSEASIPYRVQEKI